MSNVTPFASKGGSAARTGATSQQATRIHLLGMMRAVGPGGEDILPRAKKTQAVLAYLCLAQGERVRRTRIAGVIWDRSGEAQARDSLRHALQELRRRGSWRLEADYATLRLDIAGCWIDAFESPEQSDLLLDSLQGISSSFDQWLLGERARFENRWQSRLEEELNALIAKDSPPESRAAAARTLLNFVPTHESAVRGLMTAFVDLGDCAQAIREYERFRVMAHASLGMAPSEKTTALYGAIRLGAQIRPVRSPNRPPLEGTAGTTTEQGGAADPNPGAPARALQPSIAVLPFRNLSGKAGHDCVAEGLAEDLVELLSRVPGLSVISRLSAAAFRTEERSPREIGEVLGVRYVLSGSVRVDGGRLRLVVELSDTGSGAALWRSRLDESFSDMLEVQNRLAKAVVRCLAPHVRSAELRRARIKRPEHHDAYELLLRAQESMHNPTRAVFETAQQLFELAIDREPKYAAALAWRAYWHAMRVGQGWSPDPERDTAQAEYFAGHAAECDATEPMAFAVQGHVAAYLRKDFDLAFACFETALGINPNGARAWLWNADAHAWIGEGAHAVAKINRAIALSPYDPLVCAYSGGASMAYLSDGQYERAIEFALRCMRENRGYTAAYKLLILALVLAGREAEARTPVHLLLGLEPGFTVERFRRRFPGSAGPLSEPYCNAFERAGVPLSD